MPVFGNATVSNSNSNRDICMVLCMEIQQEELELSRQLYQISYEAISHELSKKGTTLDTLRKICQCVKKQPNSAYRDSLIEMICNRLSIVGLSPEYIDALYDLSASL